MSDWTTVWARAGSKVMSDTFLERKYATRSGREYWLRVNRRSVAGDLWSGNYRVHSIVATVKERGSTWTYEVRVYEPEEGPREAEAVSEFCPYEEGLACFLEKAYPHAGAALAWYRAMVERIEHTKDGSRSVIAVAKRIERKVEEWIRREREL